MYEVIAIEQVHPAEDNVRRRLGDTRDLAASIASVGIVEPLLVTPAEGGGYTVVAGHRRLAAAQAAGLTEVPCTIRTLTDLERVEIMVAENLARAGLSVIEEATGYFRMAEFGLTAMDLAKRLGRSAAHVKARLALLELPKAAKAKLDAGGITVGEATALLALKDHPESIARLIGEGADPWEGRDLERAVVREVVRIEAEAKAAAAREALEEAGVRIVEKWERFGNRPGQAVALGVGHGDLDVKPAKHAKEPCHAAHISHGGEIVLLCTDPARHRPNGDSTTKAPEGSAPTRSESRATERADARQRRAVEAERRAFTADLLARRLPKADTHALVAGQQVAAASPTMAKAACGLLGVEADDTYGAHQRALVAYAGQSSTRRDLACLALALAAGDDALAYDPTGDGNLAGTHLAFLAAYGWPPAPASEQPSESEQDNSTVAEPAV